MTGESAAGVARRRRDKAARLTRQAELWERGAAGEEQTAAVLAALPAMSWIVFHDIRWPGRTYANIDHVVVGPPGVFVIDTKNWSGRVTVKDGVLRQNGYSREKNVVSAAEAALVVARLVPTLDVRLVQPVICFASEDSVAGTARDVAVASTSSLTRLLLSRPAALGPEAVRVLAMDLDAQFRAATEPSPARRQAHEVVCAAQDRVSAQVVVRAHRSRPARSVGARSLAARLVLTGAMLAALISVPNLAYAAITYVAR